MTAPILAAVLNCFGDLAGLSSFTAFQVGNRVANLEDAAQLFPNIFYFQGIIGDGY